MQRLSRKQRRRASQDRALEVARDFRDRVEDKIERKGFHEYIQHATHQETQQRDLNSEIHVDYTKAATGTIHVVYDARKTAKGRLRTVFRITSDVNSRPQTAKTAAQAARLFAEAHDELMFS